MIFLYVKLKGGIRFPNRRSRKPCHAKSQNRDEEFVNPHTGKGRDYYRFIQSQPTSRWRHEMIPRKILIRVCPLEAIFSKKEEKAHLFLK